VLSLRILGRLIKSNNQENYINLTQDPNYKEFILKAESSVEFLNEYEILDFLFWLRRFRMYKIPALISSKSYELIFKRIEHFIRSKTFNYKNLVNLYFDYSCLNRNTDELCLEIFKELRADIKLLTPITLI
jgi:hypothetical protein